MTISFSFDHELPSGQGCSIEAEIEPLVPAQLYGEPGDCYPEEGGTASIVSLTVNGVEIDMDDVWVRKRPIDLINTRFVHYLDDVADTAYDKWSNEQ